MKSKAMVAILGLVVSSCASISGTVEPLLPGKAVPRFPASLAFVEEAASPSARFLAQFDAPQWTAQAKQSRFAPAMDELRLWEFFRGGDAQVSVFALRGLGAYVQNGKQGFQPWYGEYTFDGRSGTTKAGVYAASGGVYPDYRAMNARMASLRRVPVVVLQSRPGMTEGIGLNPPFSFRSLQGEVTRRESVGEGTADRVDVEYRQISLVVTLFASREALLAQVRPEVLFPGGYSVIDGYDRQGYDKEGWDRNGIDRFGWSNPTYYSVAIASVAKGGPAAKAGFVVGEKIVSIDGRRVLHSADQVVDLISSYQPRDTITVVRVVNGVEKSVAVTLGEYPGQPGAPFLGVGLGGLEVYRTEAKSQNLDGSVWQGRLSAGRQGRGVFTSPDGSRLLGEFVNDRPVGRAVWLSATQVPHIQEYRNGELASDRLAAGSIWSPSLNWVYLGASAVDSWAEGTGDAITVDGTWRVTNGQFHQGRLVRGTMVDPQGTVYTGTFSNDVLEQGEIRWPTGAVYNGGLKGGQPDGKGSLTAADGTSYTGGFARGRYDGTGVITRPNGERYEGQFRNGKPHGIGIYFNGNDVERCEYYEGQRIDQAFLIREENRKQLALIQAEREKIAREKADQAEQDRLERERQAVAATSARSSDGLLGSILVGTLTFGVGAAVGLDASSAGLVALGAASDAYRGDTSGSATKAAAGLVAQAKGAAPAPASAPETAAPKKTLSRRSTITFRGHPSADLTCDIDRQYFKAYTLVEGSVITILPGGRGTIFYKYGAMGMANTNPPLEAEWGVQLKVNGEFALTAQGELILSIVAHPDPRDPQKDVAELLYLKDGTARRE